LKNDDALFYVVNGLRSCILKKTMLAKLRYCFSIAIVGLFLFPIGWWALTSIKPASAIFDRDRAVFFDFEPTLANYYMVLGSDWNTTMEGRSSIISSTIIAGGSTVLTTIIALMAAFALSRMRSLRDKPYLNIILLQRILPPIAIIIPLVFVFRDLRLHDTHLGLIFAHTLINLPLALLLLKSFMDDIPFAIDDAAMIDGATRQQCFWKIHLPMMWGGIAATAILCFVFSWTEFILAVFLTNTIQTVPVKITTFSSWTYGYASALGTSALLPAFILILICQRQLVRALTMGAIKD